MQIWVFLVCVSACALTLFAVWFFSLIIFLMRFNTLFDTNSLFDERLLCVFEACVFFAFFGDLLFIIALANFFLVCDIFVLPLANNNLFSFFVALNSDFRFNQRFILFNFFPILHCCVISSVVCFSFDFFGKNFVHFIISIAQFHFYVFVLIFLNIIFSRKSDYSSFSFRRIKFLKNLKKKFLKNLIFFANLNTYSILQIEFFYFVFFLQNKLGWETIDN